MRQLMVTQFVCLVLVESLTLSYIGDHTPFHTHRTVALGCQVFNFKSPAAT